MRTQLERLAKVARSCPLRRSIEAGIEFVETDRARADPTVASARGNGGRVVSRKQIVILGGGTGGTMTANRLRRRFDPDEAEIHVVDRDDRHVYQPGLLFVPFGLAQLDEIVRPRRRQLRNGVVFHRERGRGGLRPSATRCCSTTEPCSPTTCSSSRPACACSRRRPRA